MKAHCESAQILAEWLSTHEKVEKFTTLVYLLMKVMNLLLNNKMAFGGIVSFVVKGEREGAWKVIDNTKFISITGNLGDVKSTITHPATTTHGKLLLKQKKQLVFKKV